MAAYRRVYDSRHLQADSDGATELSHLLAGTTQLHLRAVSLSLVPVKNVKLAHTRVPSVRVPELIPVLAAGIKSSSQVAFTE